MLSRGVIKQHYQLTKKSLMITKDNIKQLLTSLEFIQDGNTFKKTYSNAERPLIIDVKAEHIYYKEAGITVGRDTTSNFSEPENFVVLECVDRLLSKGYNPTHIELEPHWKLGHSAKSGWADIWVRTYKTDVMLGTDEDKDSLLIIECKTKGHEFDNAWNDTKEDGAQLFSYFQQERATKFLCLYTSELLEGKVVPEYYLINVQDNEALLSSYENARSYKTAMNNRQLYGVWHDTYACDYATKGLFEAEIQPYQIGKNKYTVNDLIEVDNDSIKKKYNEFAVILRQHNVGAHENAFDKLVNLFLAKVVDETNNVDDLHFYWKGAAYDDDFQLQDRLQRLYRDGMRKFLGEEVTYIENKEIEKAFRRFKNDPDATKKTIMEYFRALKFFSDNDFSFISVHNEKLFRQNAVILRKVIKMFQDIRLKTSEANQNQFLGDLFEGFLTKGVKQSEGQFFTPMPIVRFIVSALPLESIIKDSEGIPWAIDYACGAGHFLTEYAIRIKEFAKKYRPEIPLKDYYAHITGVEKEYRLSKVSKVSAFMYGHDDINIIYSDALVPHPAMKSGGYDVLIANPPYAVSGFLDTLSEQERNSYKLFSSNINIDKNNAIETFFIERAAQLMKSGGVAGIVLPISVQTKGGIYTRAREIILQKFDIISLVEFGSGTFGKTGTNTVVMFLRRKETNTPDDEHYRNRVNSWFSQHNEADTVYEDENLLVDYCTHCKHDINDYKEFLNGTINQTMWQTEIMQTYSASFFGNARNAMKDVCEEAKMIRNKYQTRIKTKAFKTSPNDEQKKETDKAFYTFVRAIEKEKVYFFILANLVETPVVIVKSPSVNADIKKFLGYEWSDSKGSEGIKYLNVEKIKTVDEEGNNEDDDTMKQIRSINGIDTPLFNPNNLSSSGKINTIIRKNFQRQDFCIGEANSSYVTVGKLVDMLDFTRTSFNLEFKTSASLKVNVESKYDTITLKQFCSAINPPKDEFKDIPKETKVSFIEMSSLGQGYIINKEEKSIDELSSRGYTNFRENDVLIAKITPCMENGKCALAENLTNEIGLGSTEFHVIRAENREKAKFILEYLNREDIRIIAASNMIGSSGHRRVPEYFYQNLLIPNVPQDVINKIVSECEAEDEKYQKAKSRIEKIEEEIEKIMNEAQSKAANILRLDDKNKFNILIGRRVLKNEIVEDGEYDVLSANIFEPFGKTKYSVLTDFTKPSILWGIDGDWMVGYREENNPFNPTDHCGVIRVLDQSIVIPRYLVYALLKAGELERFSRVKRASTERIKALSIKVPSIKIQENAINQTASFETELKEQRTIIRECATRKQAILDKYLK